MGKMMDEIDNKPHLKLPRGLCMAVARWIGCAFCFSIHTVERKGKEYFWSRFKVQMPFRKSLGCFLEALFLPGFMALLTKAEAGSGRWNHWGGCSSLCVSPEASVRQHCHCCCHLWPPRMREYRGSFFFFFETKHYCDNLYIRKFTYFKCTV